MAEEAWQKQQDHIFARNDRKTGQILQYSRRGWKQYYQCERTRRSAYFVWALQKQGRSRQNFQMFMLDNLVMDVDNSGELEFKEFLEVFRRVATERRGQRECKRLVVDSTFQDFTSKSIFIQTHSQAYRINLKKECLSDQECLSIEGRTCSKQ